MDLCDEFERDRGMIVKLDCGLEIEIPEEMVEERMRLTLETDRDIEAEKFSHLCESYYDCLTKEEKESPNISNMILEHLADEIEAFR